MGLFGPSLTPEEKVERQLNQEQAMMNSLGLGYMTDSIDIEAIKKINGMLNNANRNKDALVRQSLFTQVLIEQNFIIMRQLEKLINR